MADDAVERLKSALIEIDQLWSVPMMKTHDDQSANAHSPGIAYEIVAMVRANKLGLTVVDGSMAMEGQGPSDGDLVKMDVIPWTSINETWGVKEIAA